MLSKIKIENYQSHRNTEIELHPGINALTGTSDAGKSSLIRAISFLATNRPLGMAFISHGEKSSAIEMTFDGTKVARNRGKNENSYTLGSKRFDVVKSDVPEEVSDFLNFGDTTIQGQHDRYFLLQDTPGEVAKKLNKVANIDIIDGMMSLVNSSISENSRDIKSTQKEIDRLDVELLEYDSVERIAEMLISLNDSIDIRDRLVESLDGIDKACKKADETKAKIESLTGWLAIEEDLLAIHKLAQERKGLADRRKAVESAIGEVESLEDRIEILSSQQECEEKVKHILSAGQKREQLYTEISTLSVAIEEIEKGEADIKELSGEIKKLTDKAVGIIKRSKVCPLCGKDVTGEALDHIRSWI